MEVVVQTDEGVVQPEHPEVTHVPAQEHVAPGYRGSLLGVEQVLPHHLLVLVLEGGDHHVLPLQKETAHSLLYTRHFLRLLHSHLTRRLDDQVAQTRVDGRHVLLLTLTALYIRHSARPLYADVALALFLGLPPREDGTLGALLQTILLPDLLIHLLLLSLLHLQGLVTIPGGLEVQGPVDSVSQLSVHLVRYV